MKKINAYQVAKLAHVSPATVSRAINHRQQVNPKTLRQIDDAMRTLNFSPTIDDYDRLLIINTSDLTNIFDLDVINGIKSAAQRFNMRVMVDQTQLNKDNIVDYISYLERFHPYGVITLDQHSEKVLNKLAYSYRLVQCCEYNPNSQLPFVTINDYQAATKATNYLIASGCKKLAFLNTTGNKRYAVQRTQGFKDSMTKHNLSINSHWLLSFNAVSFNESLPIVEQVFSSGDYPDAFLCTSDTIAAAVLKSAYKYHVNIPNEVSIMGFDNTIISKVVSPTLSTVSIPAFQEGFTAVQLITKSYEKQQQITLPSELILRQTTL